MPQTILHRIRTWVATVVLAVRRNEVLIPIFIIRPGAVLFRHNLRSRTGRNLLPSSRTSQRRAGTDFCVSRCRRFQSIKKLTGARSKRLWRRQAIGHVWHSQTAAVLVHAGFPTVAYHPKFIRFRMLGSHNLQGGFLGDVHPLLPNASRPRTKNGCSSSGARRGVAVCVGTDGRFRSGRGGSSSRGLGREFQSRFRQRCIRQGVALRLRRFGDGTVS